jgi:2-(1,2-epoxy-1,2-dihydrophenyl)acetyl-CoA isomerase
VSETQATRLDRHGPVAVITLNSPQTRNALGEAVASGLHAALMSVAPDPAVRVVVLTGAGGAFSAGADLKEGLPETHRVEDMINSRYRPSLELIAGMDKPVIAAVAGPAAGIGMSFALVCDLVVMAENGFEAERIPADRCLAMGLVNRVVATDTLLSETLAWAGELAERAPLALARTKRAMRQAMSLSFGDTVALEAALQNECATSADTREGVQAFLEKRKPQFEGR